jgi:hypothetical protein
MAILVIVETSINSFTEVVKKQVAKDCRNEISTAKSTELADRR